MLLSQTDKKTLLSLARESIKIFLKNKQRTNEIVENLSTSLNEIRGAFVTLKSKDRLRGCIGEIMPKRALFQAVAYHAVNSAFFDPRFPSLSEDEFTEINIEISALTVPEDITSYQEISLGRDGILLTKEQHSAVFLPQVAIEQGWDLKTTLNHLSVKAGLPANGWQEGASFKVFQAEVFSE